MSDDPDRHDAGRQRDVRDTLARLREQTTRLPLVDANGQPVKPGWRPRPDPTPPDDAA